MQFDLAKISEEIHFQGLNQVVLSQRTKISVSWINKVLRGEGVPSARVVKALAEAVGLDIRKLAKSEEPLEQPKRRRSA